MAKTKQLQAAYDAQDIAIAALKAWDRDHKNEKGETVLGEYGPLQLSQLMRAFAESQERVRICRNKPLPGSLRPEKKGKSRKLAELIALEPLGDDPARDVQEQPAQEQSAPAQDQASQAAS
jgi:hypothetical protein